MFNIGDLVIYSTHGICRVDEISDKTVSGITRPYYILHPLENNHQLTISTPVDSKQVVMLELLHKKEAEEILDSFKEQGAPWIDNPSFRYRSYSDTINTGNRNQIAKIINVFMRKEKEAKLNNKKLYEQDRKLLNSTQNTLFKEIAIVLDTTIEDVNRVVEKLLHA